MAHVRRARCGHSCSLNLGAIVKVAKQGAKVSGTTVAGTRVVERLFNLPDELTYTYNLRVIGNVWKSDLENVRNRLLSKKLMIRIYKTIT